MTETNRLQFCWVRESTFGTMPVTPRMRLARLDGEGIKYTPKVIQPSELRSDRMNALPVKINEDNAGPVNGELSYPEADSPLSDWIRSLEFSDWVNSPTFDNDGTADSVVTDAGTTSNTYVVASGGASVKAGHLVWASGFTNAANNQKFKVASSSATTVVGTALSLTAETAPPAAAKLKVIGFMGAASDITAAAGGLASTALDLTTLGLAKGMWLKIDSTTSAMGFATAANNDWIRISGTITATSIPCDNLPSGWAVDAGTGKTIKVYFGDYIKNGTTRTSGTIERGWLGQTTPSYILQKGMVATQGDFDFTTEAEIKWSFTFNGLTGSQGTATQDAAPDAATTNSIMSSNVNVGRIAEGGSIVGTTNPVKTAKISLANNPRMWTGVGSVGNVDIRAGDCSVTVNMDAYFGDNSLLTKLMALTTTSFNIRSAMNSQAVVWDVPQLTWTDGPPTASAKNQDSTTALVGMASYESTFAAHLIINRIPFYN